MENTRSSIENKIIKIKKLLSSENTAIELYDFCTDELRCFLSLTDQDNFQIQGSFSTADFINRISKYEESINDLSILTACISYWAKPIHMPLLQKLFARITDRLDSQSGLVIWLYLRWYPIVYMLYCSGISAVENNRYDSLSRIFFTKITSPDNKNKEVYLVEAVGKTLSELSESNVFKSLPGYEKNLVPMSEYLFKMLQPKIDDLLFIGKNYERAFDKFEVMLSLIVADLKKEKGEYIWGPIGRFGYKNIFPTEGPLQSVLIEAKELQDNWEPLKNGFFGGSYSRFEKLFPEVNKLISKRGWS